MIPDRAVAPAHETTVVTTGDGRTVRGLLLRENGQNLSLLTPEGTVVEVPKAEAKARRKEKASLMSEALADEIPRDQLRNLAEFLTAAPPAGGAGSR